MKFDMHCHTNEGSVDSKVSIEDYINRLISLGFDGMLVTDHDSYGGYRYFCKYLKNKYKDFVVLKGIEYDTLDAGHIIVVLPRGCNLKIMEHRGLPIKVLMRLVHANGGIIGPAHPCGEPFLSIFSTGKYKKDMSIGSEFDFIEAYNSGEDDASNQLAAQIAEAYEKPVFGGSDAHKEDCVGLAYTIFDGEIRTENDLINYVKAAKPTSCGGEQYMGTLKLKLGKWNKLLVYGFYPYNRVNSLVHHKKRTQLLINQIDSKISNEHVEKMKEHIHHGRVTTYEHCLNVLVASHQLMEHLNIKDVDWDALHNGAMLHDFYLYDWHNEDNGEHKWHGYHHADKAIENANKYFHISPKEQDIIRTHMWPLNITRLPRSKEAWSVCLADKYVSLKETLLKR